MQNNFPKIQLLVSTIIFLFAVFLFFFFSNMINDNNIGFQFKEEKWQIETFKRDEIRMLNASMKTIEEEKSQLEKHFAKSSDIVPFLDTIEALALKTGAKAETTSVDIEANNASLLVGMKATGTFNSLYKFLTLLENSPYELKFMGMNLNKENGTDPVGKNTTSREWNVIFKIKLLSFVE